MKRRDSLMSILLPVVAIGLSGCGSNEPGGRENGGSDGRGSAIGVEGGNAPEAATTAGSASSRGRGKPEDLKLDVGEVLAIEKVLQMKDWEKSRPVRPDPHDPHELDRRRPAALYVVCQGDLKTPAATTMEHAECLANCGYDVRIAVGLGKDQDRLTSRAMGTVCKAILDINKRLAERNSDEEKLLAGRADLAGGVKLKPLCRPDEFADGHQLRKLIDDWLVSNFAVTMKSMRKNGEAFDERPPFGALFLSGHGGILTRPDKNLAPHAIRHYFTATETPQFDVGSVPPADQAILVEDVATLAATRYYAPLWIVPDMCRIDRIADPVPPFIVPFQVVPYGPRVIDKAKIPAEFHPALDRVERLRSVASPDSGLLRNSPLRIKDATFVVPDEAGVPVFDEKKYSFLHAQAQLMKTELESDGRRRVFSAMKGEANPASLTLDRSLLEFQNNLKPINSHRSPNDQVRPEIIAGPLAGGKVIASSQRGFEYTRIDMNLLNFDMSDSPETDGVAPSHDADGSVTTGVVHLKPVAKKEKSVRTVVLVFDQKRTSIAGAAEREEIMIPIGGPSKVVLTVVATSTTPGRKISFTAGAYTYTGGRTALSSSFGQFLDRPCDGVPFSIELPLDKRERQKASLDELELQESQNAAGNGVGWDESCSLSITGAYLLPASAAKEDLETRRAADEKIVAKHDLIRHGLFNTPLNPAEWKTKPTAAWDAARGVQSIKPEGIDPAQAAAAEWGILADFYPSRLVDLGRKRIRLKVEAVPGSENAELAVCLFAGGRAIAVWNGPLSGAAGELGVEIDAFESGFVDEACIVVKGAAQLDVQKLEVNIFTTEQR
jgi:hypothetical protein